MQKEIAAFLLLASTTFGQSIGDKSNSVTAARSRYALTWSDEFNTGLAPDPSKWKCEIGGNGWGNKELEYYTSRSQNATVRHGNLEIVARKESYTGKDGLRRDYTSARLITSSKFEQAYGRFEARIKIPYGQGVWPAFWLLGSDDKKAGWPMCGEITIMENIGREPAIVHGTIHGPGYSGAKGIGAPYASNSGRLADAFHVYAVEWEPEEIQFYVDDHLYATRKPSDLPAGTKWVYDHPFYILLNFAVGGQWPGSPDATTKFPQMMLVDYVRVYKKAPHDFGISDNPVAKTTLSGATAGGSESPQTAEENGFVKTHDGYRLFYRKIGSGPNAILVPISLFTFDGLKALARPDRTLIFYDPRNRGQSDSVNDLSNISVEKDIQDIETLREYFQLKKFSLLGYSVYGMEVALYAAEYPDHVSRIVQLGPVPLRFGTLYPSEFDNTKDRSIFDEALSKKIQMLRAEHKDETEPKEFCRTSLEMGKVGLVTTPEALQRLQPTIDHVCDYRNEWPINLNNHMIAHFVGSVMKLNVPWARVTSRVTMPVLTIHGKKDRNAPYGAGREWASKLIDARFLSLDNAAHQSWVDEPETVLGAIDQFLNGQWPQAAVALHE